MEERKFILDSLYGELCNIPNVESRANNGLISIYWNKEDAVCSIDTDNGNLEINFENYTISDPIELTVILKEDEEARLSDELIENEKKVFDTICRFNVLMSVASIEGKDKNKITLRIGGSKDIFKNGVDNRIVGENETLKVIVGDDLDFFVVNMFLLANEEISSAEQFTAVIKNLNQMRDFKGRNNTYTFSVSGLDLSDDSLGKIKDGCDDPVERIDSITFNDCSISLTRPSSLAFFDKGTKYFYNNCEFANENRFN